MTDAGELFVKIRPDTAGFKASAEGPVASAGRDLSKVFLAAFAVGGIAVAIKGVVEAATKQQAAFAVLDQVLKNAGQTTEGFSASLKDKLEVQARATGVSAEDLAAAMDRLVPATHNAQKSLTDLNTAIGISETYHISLSTAALALAKAETGSFNSLQRYLGAIPRVTTNVDELKAKYAALTAGGIKLDAGQKAQYESALKLAEAQDKLLTAQNSVSLATQKFGGVAQTFANTYAGQFARLHVNVEQLKVAVGTELVGGLASAASATNDFLSKLLASNKVQEEAHRTAHDVGVALHEIGSALSLVGPPLVSVVDDLGGFVRVGEIAAALFVAYKLSLLGAASAEEVAAASSVVLTGTLEANTAALVANTAALAADSGAAASATVIYDAYGGVLATVAAEEAAAATGAAALGTAAAGATAGVGLLARGIGLLKKGLIEYLVVNQAIKALPGQHDLGLDFSNSAGTGEVKGANGSPFPRNSPQDQLFQLGYAGKKSPITHAQLTGALNFAAVEAQREFEQGVKARQAAASGAGAQVVGAGLTAALQTAASAAQTDAKTGKTAATMGAAGKAAIAALRQGIATDQSDLTQLGKDMADAVTQGTQQIAQAVQAAKQNLSTIGASLAGTIGTFLDKPLNDEAQRLSDTQDRIASEFDNTTAYLATLGSKLSRQQAQLSLASSKQALTNLRTSVFLPGGHQLSADPRAALAQLEALEKRNPSAALREYITQYQTAFLAVRQGELGLRTSAVDARRAAKENLAQAGSDALKLRQDAAAHAKQHTLTQIANLTDLLAKNAISEPVFTRRLDAILAKNHLSFVAAAKADGIAFADTFAAQLKGLGLQEGALRAGPHQAGSGLIPSIVRPLDTVNQVQKQIAGIAHEQRRKQLDETRKSNDLLKKIHDGQKASAFSASLTKNPGGATKKHSALTGVG